MRRVFSPHHKLNWKSSHEENAKLTLGRPILRAEDQFTLSDIQLLPIRAHEDNWRNKPERSSWEGNRRKQWKAEFGGRSDSFISTIFDSLKRESNIQFSPTLRKMGARLHYPTCYVL